MTYITPSKLIILFISLIKFILNLSKSQLIINKFDQLEKISVCLNQANFSSALLNEVKNFPFESFELKRRIIGLKYRIRKINGGEDLTRAAPHQMEALIERAANWANKQHRSYSKSNLRDLLHEPGNYPLFVSFLLKNENLQDSFFNWVIRDKISAAIFIEYPSLQTKIVESNLHIRVNHFKNPGLKIQFDHLNRKIVTLLIEGKEVNILDTKKHVQLRGHWTLTIDQIFEIFKMKTYYNGNLEFTEEGIINWNVFEWGYWDDHQKKIIDVNFEEENWWRSLPLFNTISIEEASRELGHKLDGTNWAVEACASRRYQNLNLFENHAFLKVLFPSSDGLGYSTLPLGKYAKSRPLSMNALKGFSILCDMTPATISFIDENIFYNFREQTKYGFLITQEQGKHFFETIKKDMLLSKEKHLVYQIETENCAKWAQETLTTILGEENVPNLYKTNFLYAEAQGVLGWMMKILRKTPKSWQAWLVTRFHLPLGAFKGSWIVRNGVKHWVSLMTLPFWNNAMIYFPAFLHHQMKQGLLVAKKIYNKKREKVLFFFYTEVTSRFGSRTSSKLPGLNDRKFPNIRNIRELTIDSTAGLSRSPRAKS